MYQMRDVRSRMRKTRTYGFVRSEYPLTTKRVEEKIYL